ncbi:MAG: lipase family protein, partial [Bacteroides sp.]|nr:lipase family protein [Bacteroides sp.]
EKSKCKSRIQLFRSKILLVVLVCMAFSACTEQEFFVAEEGTAPVTRSTDAVTQGITELPGFSFEEILEVVANLGTDFVEAISPILEAIDIPGDLASAALRTYKVSTETPHPDGSGSMITVSGVVIVPANYDGDSIRFVISPVPTYTENDAAPSIIFSGERDVPLLYDNFLNYLYFTALNTLQDCAIFMPDYPGFGDSFGQCFHPYAVKEPMIRSTLDLAKAAKSSLTDLGYTLKKEVIVSGYSQGGLVATAVGRELDLNGAAHDMPLNLLLAGGVPADLKALFDIARVTPALPLSFVFPYAIYGYQQNGYPELNLGAVLNYPFSYYPPIIFDGYHSVADALVAFPLTNVGLFTLNAILDNVSVPTIALLNDILIENSIEPWKNNAPVVFIHGLLDEAVYYENVLIYQQEMEAVGGTPELHTNPLTEHVLTLFDYFVELPIYISQYK